MNQKRESGILLHIASLPNKYGVGTLGKEAFKFVDFLDKAKMSIWQVLPLAPTGFGDSPYQSVSSNALNYFFIDLDILKEKGLLTKSDIKHLKVKVEKVDFEWQFNNKIPVLRKAFSNFDKKNPDFLKFINDGVYNDFSLYMALKSMNDFKCFKEFDLKYQNYSLKIEKEISKTDEYLFWAWTQFEFLDEWKKLHDYAKSKGIKIMGDMPLYVAYDSAEVYKHKELFKLDDNHNMLVVAGCPPDIFSSDGQLWGNPIYDWEYMKKTNYKWWNDRINYMLKLFDIVRIDHFRGFDRYYEIDGNADTAKNGIWVDGPKFDLFKDKLDLNIVAEDLGIIDDGVRNLLRQTNYPGMKILEYAFDGHPDNDHKPSNYDSNRIVYTGTHDNMPLMGYIDDLSENDRNIFISDLILEANKMNLKYKVNNTKEICKTIIKMAFKSVADTCIIPTQDLLFEGKDKRMNTPSTLSKNNWSYRIKKRKLSLRLALKLKKYNQEYRRMK